MKTKFLIPIVIILLVCPTFCLAVSSVEGTPPMADFTYSPSKPIVDERVTFDASGSSGDNLTFTWRFGDGHAANGLVVNHTYKKAMDYVVILVVTNSTGVVDTISEKITVEEDPGEWR